MPFYLLRVIMVVAGLLVFKTSPAGLQDTSQSEEEAHSYIAPRESFGLSLFGRDTVYYGGSDSTCALMAYSIPNESERLLVAVLLTHEKADSFAEWAQFQFAYGFDPDSLYPPVGDHELGNHPQYWTSGYFYYSKSDTLHFQVHVLQGIDGQLSIIQCENGWASGWLRLECVASLAQRKGSGGEFWSVPLASSDTVIIKGRFTMQIEVTDGIPFQTDEAWEH